MKIPSRSDENPKLEMLVQQTSYHERDNALAELNAAIAAILQPRGGYRFYSGSSTRHFLPIPPSAQVSITKAGFPSHDVNEKEAEELQRQLTAITLEEKRLESAAGMAKNQREAIVRWGQALGEVEDRLLLAGSVLDESDSPAVESYLAEHRRYIRTVNAWTAKLQF